jgi:hypothetical protein
MLADYDRQWARLHAVSSAAGRVEGGMPESEARFYSETWLEDNTPYDPKHSEVRQVAWARKELAAWVTNLALIVLQMALQLPSVLSLLWFSTSNKGGWVRACLLACLCRHAALGLGCGGDSAAAIPHPLHRAASKRNGLR